MVVDTLTDLFHVVWHTGAIPEAWQEAEISYLYKGSGRPTEVANIIQLPTHLPHQRGGEDLY